MPHVRVAVRLAYAPLLLVGMNGLAFAAISRGSPPWMLCGLLLGAIALSFAAEHLLPYNPDWNRSHGDRGRDALHALVNEGANASTLLMLPVFAQIAPASSLWPGGWPFVLQVLFAILVLDAGSTASTTRSGPMWAT